MIFLNHFRDIEREFQGIPRGGVRLSDAFPGDETVQEELQLFFKRLGFFNVDGFLGYLGADLADDLSRLVSIVERNVGVFLEDADLTLFFERETRSGDVGDGSILEFQPDVCDIFEWCQDIDAGCVKTGNVGFYEAEHDIEIMDHEIEYDAAIVDAAGEGPKAVDLEETDVSRDLFHAFESGIMTFDMPDLECAMVFPGKFKKFIRLAQAKRDRFFNQGVDTGFEELFCDLMVGGGGGGDANGFDFPDQVTEILKVGSSEFLGFISLGGVRVADANKLGFRKVPINAGVLFTEVSDAYDCNI